MFEGLYTALITPFNNGTVDYDSLQAIIEKQIAGGVDGVVPMGTTGESPTVSFEEHITVIKKVVQFVNKRVKVIAGAGANATDEAIWLSKEAEGAGADAVLSVNPYYNKPTQRGLIAHFEAIASSIKIPVMLYNIPGRTGVNFLPESINELLNRVGNVVAIKEATGDIVQMMRVIELCGDRLTLVSGDDNLLLPVLSIGGKGVVSVLSNVFPKDVKKVITLYNNGNVSEARAQFYKMLPLSRAMFIETNPIPVKTTMAMLGYCAPDLRLPLCGMSEENQKLLRKALQDYGVL